MFLLTVRMMKMWGTIVYIQEKVDVLSVVFSYSDVHVLFINCNVKTPQITEYQPHDPVSRAVAAWCWPKGGGGDVSYYRYCSAGRDKTNNAPIMKYVIPAQITQFDLGVVDSESSPESSLNIPLSGAPSADLERTAQQNANGLPEIEKIHPWSGGVCTWPNAVISHMWQITA